MQARHWQVVAAVAAIAVAALLWSGAYASREQPFAEPFSWWLLQAALGGSAWVLSGLVLLGRDSTRRLGGLLIVAGALIWVTRLIDSRIPLLFTIGLHVQFALAPAAVMALLAYPTGRLTPRARIIVIGVTVAWVLHATSGVFYDPALHWCADCGPHLNVLLITPRPGLVDALYPVWITTYGLAFCSTSAVLLVRWFRASPLARRVRSPMMIPAVAYAGIAGLFFFYEASLELGLVVPPIPLTQAGTVAWFAQLVLPVTFLIGLARARARRGRVADLVAELGELPPADRLEDALRRTLRDPTLEVGYWSPEAGDYCTAAGAAVEVESDKRAVTTISGDGIPLAVLVHDPALLEDARLLDATTAAARLAIENARLAAELRAQLAEVRASRSRLVQAGDAARRRVERDLHDGAQQRLVSLSLLLRQAQARMNGSAGEGLEAALGELDAAMRELRELARGVYPLSLTQGGLAAALDSLAERAAVATIVEVAPTQRFAEAIETAAYFVTSEAVANAAKHASASTVRIRAEVRDERLVVEVSDDGRGGAIPALGGGLSGIVDRVEALDGDVTVSSAPGEGTTVRAELPCAWS